MLLCYYFISSFHIASSTFTACCNKQLFITRTNHAIAKETIRSKKPKTLTSMYYGESYPHRNFENKMDRFSTKKKTDEEIEVEQKFALVSLEGVNQIEEKLKLLGFECVGPAQRFKDSYVDVCGPPWCLTVQNYWLRYREYLNEAGETIKGVLQLKFRPRSIQTQEKQSVYKEVEGCDAIDLALSLVNTFRRQNSATGAIVSAVAVNNDHFGQYSQVIGNTGLKTFASFETTRSSWKRNTAGSESSSGVDIACNDLRVDLDATDFGHMVGEVEAIVNNEERDRKSVV